MHKDHQTIHVEPLAPDKPDFAAPCNGCGVCCLVAPCPLGMLISLRRHGACAALRWNKTDRIYRCGVVEQPVPLLQRVLPPGTRFLARLLSTPVRRLARRWIAAGQGCDCSLQVSMTDTAKVWKIHPSV